MNQDIMIPFRHSFFHEAWANGNSTSWLGAPLPADGLFSAQTRNHCPPKVVRTAALSTLMAHLTARLLMVSKFRSLWVSLIPRVLSRMTSNPTVPRSLVSVFTPNREEYLIPFMTFVDNDPFTLWPF
jgi:hypothetical protein